MTNLPIVHGLRTPGSKPTEPLLNGSNALGFRDARTTFVDLSRVPARIFSMRLNFVLTSFYEQLVSLETYGGDMPPELARCHTIATPADDLTSLVGDRDSFVARTALTSPLAKPGYEVIHLPLVERVQRALNGSVLQAVAVAFSATAT